VIISVLVSSLTTENAEPTAGRPSSVWVATNHT
jgi:hypothetical protein